MDRYSEVEIKFEADNVGYKDLRIYLTNNRLSGNDFDTHGVDTFYILNGEIVRLRSSATEVCLTIKSRKSFTDMTDRNEVDVFLESFEYNKEHAKEDAEVFLERLKAERLFSIFKTSYICRNLAFPDMPTALCTLAMYDVYTMDSNGKKSDKFKRYLEVEVEKDSRCSKEEALRCLNKWKDMLKKDLNLKDPINKSLFEIYREAQS